MRSQKIFNTIGIILFVLASMSLPKPSMASSPEIELAVSSIGENKSQNIGVIEVVFINHTNKSTVIPLCWRFGKGAHGQTQGRGFRAAFSTFSYRWLDSTGESLLDGSVFMTAPPLNLVPGATQKMLIPINVPKGARERTLEVRFDNRMVEAAVNSFNMFQFVPPGSERYQVMETRFKVERN